MILIHDILEFAFSAASLKQTLLTDVLLILVERALYNIFKLIQGESWVVSLSEILAELRLTHLTLWQLLQRHDNLVHIEALFGWLAKLSSLWVWATHKISDHVILILSLGWWLEYLHDQIERALLLVLGWAHHHLVIGIADDRFRFA